MKRKNIGSTFDSWLREEGLYEKVSATAIKRVVARQVEAAMRQKGLTKVEMARRMRTSRSALDRLLDPDNDAITLSTLQKAAAVVGTSSSTGAGMTFMKSGLRRYIREKLRAHTHGDDLERINRAGRPTEFRGRGRSWNTRHRTIQPAWSETSRSARPNPHFRSRGASSKLRLGWVFLSITAPPSSLRNSQPDPVTSNLAPHPEFIP